MNIKCITHLQVDYEYLYIYITLKMIINLCIYSIIYVACITEHNIGICA